MSEVKFEERSMVEQLSAGNAEALHQLYERYSAKLYKFIYSVVKNHDDTEDILQTVFIKLWDMRDRLRSDTCFEAFIVTMTRNTVYNYLKQLFNQRNLSAKVAGQEGGVEPPSDEMLIEADLFDLLNTLVEALPVKRREIFILNRFKGYTYKEIAELLGISENTVNTQMRKALDHIRSGLSKEVLSSFIFLFFCR